MSLATCDSVSTIVEEILVTIGKKAQEVFLPKYNPNRPKPITWSEFIYYSILENKIEKVYKFCGYSSSGNYTEGIKKRHASIVSLKGKQPWRYYFLMLVNKKYCASCNTIKSTQTFSKKESRIDRLRSSCKECDSLYWASNKEHYSEYYKTNKSYIAERDSKYRLLNKDKKAEYDRGYRLVNSHKRNAQAAKRRAAKLRAAPKWADQEKIREIYLTCPKGSHVDHIVPIQNDLVCGLHCEFNLQHLTAAENLAKSNKFEV